MSLGACRLKRRILVLVVGLGASLILISCGGGSTGVTKPPSGLLNRVLASQGVSSTFSAGGLVYINGLNDTLAPVRELSAGGSPGLMVLSPTRSTLAAFDAASNSVYVVDTTKETTSGSIRLPGPALSMAVPTAAVGYAAVPTATVTGFSVLGAIEVMNLSVGGITTTIGVTNAQTVISNATGSQLLVFSNDSNSVTVLSPGAAVPPVDTSCYDPNNPPPNAVCTIVPGFDRPVYAIISGSTAYIFNCGAQCGGRQASVQTLDLNTLAVGVPLPVNGATYGLLNGSTLYVAGKGTPTGPLCASLPNAATTSATYCGTLDIVDLGTMTDSYFNNPAAEIAITDGYHDQMDLSVNGQLFIGAQDCTNIGNVNNPNGEVRGCLAIFNTLTQKVIIPPDNGDVNGLQGFTSRNVEYVAEGGTLRVYDTTRDVLLINDFVPAGNIAVVGYVGDVKAIDFF